MVEESPGSFQLYRDWEIPSETTATGRELPTIHIYHVIVSPAGLAPTRQRCVASRKTNLCYRLSYPGAWQSGTSCLGPTFLWADLSLGLVVCNSYHSSLFYYFLPISK